MRNGKDVRRSEAPVVSVGGKCVISQPWLTDHDARIGGGGWLVGDASAHRSIVEGAAAEQMLFLAARNMYNTT